MDRQTIIRVLLADDHAVVRKGIREFLEANEDIEIVAEASDGEQALAYAMELQPDVAVLDIQMPHLTGIEVTARLHTEYPDIKVLILTAYDYDPYILSALRAGASGYVMKTARAEDLVQAVRTVCEGGSALDPLVTRKMVAHLTHTGLYSDQNHILELPSEREMDVLRLVARGLSNRGIAAALNISPRTVQGHLANLFEKLGVSTRTEAALLAVKMGWVALEE